jgi:hypothetical protein
MSILLLCKSIKLDLHIEVEYLRVFTFYPRLMFYIFEFAIIGLNLLLV